MCSGDLHGGSAVQGAQPVRSGDLDGALQCRGEYTREGIHVQIQLIHFAAQQTPTEHCKATIVQLKKNGNFDSSKVIVKR